MTKNNFKFISTKELLEDNQSNIPIDNKTRIFKDSKVIEHYFKPNLSRKRFLDFNIDLFELMDTENKLINANKIPENNLLFQKAINVYNNLNQPLKQQADYFFTVAYLEGAHNHWNRINLINDFNKQRLIQTEIDYDGGEFSYDIFLNKLGDKFLKEIKLGNQIEDLYNIHDTFNLKERNLLSLIYVNGNTLKLRLALDKKIDLLNLNIDFDKIKANIKNSEVKYHNLLLMNNTELNNLPTSFNLNSKKIDTNLLNFSKFNYMDYSMSNMVSGRTFWDINKKELRTIVDCIEHYKQDEFLGPLVKDYFESKLKLSSKNKLLWQGIYLNFYLEKQQQPIKKQVKI